MAKRINFLFLLLALSGFSRVSAEPIPVKQKQGSVHGFLVLKSAEGKIIAIGDQINTVTGNRVRSRLVLHFRDGSIDDELSVFEQEKFFRLLSDHHIQKGPSFPEPLDLNVNVTAGEVTWHEQKDGHDQVKTEHMDLPGDLVNGMASLIVENFPAKATEMRVSYLAGSGKPRVVKLSVKPEGEDTFQVEGARRRANRFNAHVEIGGVTGVIAPVIGKQPSDIKVWIAQGEVPVFLKLKGALYTKGPVWTMQLTAPVWP